MIGQAAVEAGVVSNTLVIVVSLTGLSSFASPVYALAVAVRILRFLLILLASVFGLYGMVLGLIVMVAHLAPVAPFIVEDLNDVFIRFPAWAMKWRPSYLSSEAPLRQPKSKSPTPPPHRIKEALGREAPLRFRMPLPAADVSARWLLGSA